MRASPLLNGLLALIAGLSDVPSTAQDTVRTTALPVEWITVDDGLPQGTVEVCFHDRAEYLWITTPAGLVRSDGYSMRVFRHQANDSNSLSSTDVGGLFQSQDGAILSIRSLNCPRKRHG